MPEPPPANIIPGPRRPGRRRLYELLLAAASVAFVVLLLLLAELALRRWQPDYLDDQPHAGLARLHRYSEVYGWELRPGATAVIDGRHTSINRLGHRGVEPGSERRPGRPRVVLLGDSVAFGYGVDDEHTFAAGLAARGVEVVNLAVPGYGTDQALLKLEREGLSWRPHVVLLHFCLENDFVDNVSSRFFYDGVHPKPYFTLEGDALRLRQEHLRLWPLARAGLWLRERSHLLNHLRPRPKTQGREWEGRKRAALADETAARQVTLRIVARAAETARAAGARFCLVVHPNREAFQSGSPWLDALLHSPLPAPVERVDMGAAFRARGLAFRQATLEAIGHLNDRGHAVAAEVLHHLIARPPARP